VKRKKRDKERWPLAWRVLTALAALSLVVRVAWPLLAEARGPSAREPYGELARCMLGEPLGPGERAIVRLRHNAMVALDPREKSDWPKRCMPHVQALDAALASDGLGDGALALEVKLLIHTLEQNDSFQFFSVAQRFDDLVALAEDARLDAWGKGSGPRLLAAEPLDGTSLPPIAAEGYQLQFVGVDPVRPSTPSLSLALNRLRWAELCDLELGGSAAGARCRKVPEEVPIGDLEPRNTESGKPLFFARPGGMRDAERFELMPGENVDAYGDDRVTAALHFVADRPELVWRVAGGAERTEPLGADQKAEHAIMLGPHVFFAAGKLFATRVPEGDGGLPAAQEIGAAMKNVQMGCLAGERAAAVFEDEDDGAHLSVRDAGRWSPLRRLAQRYDSIACREADGRLEVVLTDLDAKAGAVRRARCTAESCEEASVALATLSLAHQHAIREADAIDLGGKILLVWNGGFWGGVRARVADLDSLATAPDILVYDARIVSTVIHEIGLYSAGPGAVLLMPTDRGALAVHVTPEGSFRPIRKL
jgi:hypothetical protein